MWAAAQALWRMVEPMARGGGGVKVVVFALGPRLVRHAGFRTAAVPADSAVALKVVPPRWRPTLWGGRGRQRSVAELGVAELGAAVGGRQLVSEAELAKVVSRISIPGR